jgi:hypothetical protein
MEIMVSYFHSNILMYYTVRYPHNNYNNFSLAPHVSTCIGHLQVTVKRNGVLVVHCTYIIAVGDVAYIY